VPDDELPRVPDDELARGTYVMSVCNACRYCEQYCPVFPAMEQRRTFSAADLRYLANLCHNCGECLYACQYAPPHEFGINVPQTLAAIRTRSYEKYCWPQLLAGAYKRSSLMTSLSLTLGAIAVMAFATSRANPDAMGQSRLDADFYAVVPHGVMVTLFGGVFLFVLTAWAIGLSRFWREQREGARSPVNAHLPPPSSRASASIPARALLDMLTLRHLHATGVDCTSAEDTRRPWRRWFHHCTFYGFMLCFASTSVAAIYHSVFGWVAPYDYASLPVVLGAIGGLGLLIGPAGLLVVRARRDAALTNSPDRGLDDAFLVLLFLASLTGLVLLVMRHEPAMGLLLIVHLGVVLALFLTLPYGKFVHGLYRAAALVKAARERTL
jgi:citrate/tricarballylate utilization protein